MGRCKEGAKEGQSFSMMMPCVKTLLLLTLLLTVGVAAHARKPCKTPKIRMGTSTTVPFLPGSRTGRKVCVWG